MSKIWIPLYYMLSESVRLPFQICTLLNLDCSGLHEFLKFEFWNQI